MFRPLLGHHQAFLGIKSINAVYMLGSQLCVQLVFCRIYPTIDWINFSLTYSFIQSVVGYIRQKNNFKHSWDPSMYTAFVDLIHKKAWWWPDKGRNM